MVRRRREFSQRGFTLIELVISVVILGLVSGVAVLGISGALESGRIAACSADIQSVRAAVAGYFSDNPAATGLANYNLYDGTGTLTGGANAKYLEPLSASGWYTVVLAAADANGPTIKVVKGTVNQNVTSKDGRTECKVVIAN